MKKLFSLVMLVFLSLTSTSSAAMKCAPGKCGNSAKADSIKPVMQSSLCSVCGMKLKMFPNTSYKAVVNGKEKYYCSLHCLTQSISKGENPKKIEVIDVQSLKYIDAEKAFYVVGSTRRGTMSNVSKYAFLSKKDAESFVKNYGGKIVDFQEAMNVAQKDFKK